MLFGSLPRSPLATLHSYWSQRDTPPVKLNRDCKEYVQTLQENIQALHEIAVECAQVKQQVYTDRYNVDTHEKQFQIGQTVLLLIPDSTNKIKSRFITGTVVKQLDSHSYSVATNDGAVKIVHANVMRPYKSIQAVGVIFDDDATEFGNVETCPIDADVTEFEDKLCKVQVDHLSEDEKSQLFAILRKHQKVFSDKAGTCNLGEATLPTKEGFEFRTQKPYRIPEKLRPEIDSQISELLQQNKIQKENSPFAHPVVVVAKKSQPGSSIPAGYRLAIDFRILNEGLVNSALPVPRADDLLRDVASAKYLTTLDCTAGYWAIVIKPEDRYKTGFVVNDQQYVWNVLPFGIKTASQIYQTFINRALQPVSAIARSYIDDTCIKTKEDCFSTHMMHLDEVLTALGNAGFTLKLSKCRFGCRELNFIGFTVGNGVIKANFDRLDAIRRIPVPQTKKAMKSFIGTCAYLSATTANFAEIAYPLYELTKQSVSNKLKLNTVELEAFNALKLELMRATERYIPNYDKDFELYVDASLHSIAGCLLQFDDNGVLHPIGFMSRKLNPVQQRWCVGTREAYALIEAIKSFENIVFACHINVYCDNDPIRWLLTKNPTTSKLVRWTLFVTRFAIKVFHISGKQNILADYFSRYIH